MTLVLVVRHGQASFGADDYDVLSDLGWEQARLLGAHLAGQGVRPAAVVRGTLRRQRETVEGLLAGLAEAGAPGPDPGAVRVDAGWDEFDHLGVVAAHPDLPQGGTAALDRREFQRVFVEATGRWALDEAGQGDYPETFADFVARSRRALADACARGAGDHEVPGGVVVAVTSGGPVGAVAAGLVDPDGTDRATLVRLWERFNTVCVNSSVTRVLVGSTGTRLLTFNEHTHLDRARVSYR